MMKKYIYLWMSVFIFANCSISNRISVVENARDGLKHFRLEQAPKVKPAIAKKELYDRSFKKLSTRYLFEEKTDARSEITLQIRHVKATEAAQPDFALFVVLDGEKVQLFPALSLQKSFPCSRALSLETEVSGKFTIPENLWISMVHSKKLSYLLNFGNEETAVELNNTEKNKLVEFLELCIRQRDKKFPAVPEGQVKW